MSSHPAVSVIIPAFNRSAFISRAIGSVLNQTFSDFEVIAVDDASTDDTASMIEHFVKADGRVHLARHEANMGAQAARNTGIRLARGEFIALLDSDDEWLPHKLERQIALFQRSRRATGVVYTGYAQVFEDGRPPIDFYPNRRGYIYRSLLSAYGLGPCSVIVVRKKYLEKVGLCAENIQACQEWDLCIRFSRLAAFEYVPEPLTIYHIHMSPTISKELGRDARGYLQVVTLHREEILAQCGKPVLSKHYRQAGQKFIKAGDFDMARHAFREAYFTDPTHPRSVAYFGAILLGKKGFLKLRSIWHSIHRWSP